MLTKKNKEDLKKVFNHFGYDLQYDKLCEEIIEMYTEDAETKKEFKEMVDVWIILTQHLLRDEKFFKTQFNYKLNRTLKRMEDEYYENI